MTTKPDVPRERWRDGFIDAKPEPSTAAREWLFNSPEVKRILAQEDNGYTEFTRADVEAICEAYHQSRMKLVAQEAAREIHDMLWHMDGELNERQIAAIIERKGQ